MMSMYESELVEHFVCNVSIDNFFGNNFYVLREFESDSGIPDIILLNKGDYDKLKQFKKYCQDFEITPTYAKIILLLNKRSYTSTEILSKKSGYSFGYTYNILAELCKSNIVNLRNEEWILDRSFVFPTIKPIALEFKLSNWQSALRQAHRYKRIAYTSCVVMPDSKAILLKKNIDKFSKLGIGVISYSEETGEIDTLLKAKATKPSNSTHFGSLLTLYKQASAA